MVNKWIVVNKKIDQFFFPKIWLPSLLLPISKPKTFLEIECPQSAGYLMLETWNPQIISRIFDIFSWVSCSLGLGQRVLFYHNSCPWFTEDWECSTMSHYYLFNFKEKTGIDKNDFKWSRQKYYGTITCRHFKQNWVY